MVAKVIVVCNHKGGVGKTTMSKTLAYYSAEYLNKLTLLIDLDPQGSLSQCFLNMERGADIEGGMRPPLNPNYRPDVDPPENMRPDSSEIYKTGNFDAYETEYENIDIIPAHGPSISDIELDSTRENIEHLVKARLRHFIEENVADNYDVVIIDTGPELKPIAKSAIRAADFLLIPVIPERRAVENLPQMMAAWREQVPFRTDPIRLLGLLINKYDSRSVVHQLLVDALRNEYKEFVLGPILKQLTGWINVDHPESVEKSVLDLPAPTEARKEAISVCRLVFERVLGLGGDSNNATQQTTNQEEEPA